MAFAIEKMKSALNGGGDRSAKFEVRIALPGLAVGEAGASEKLTMTCIGTDIPPSILGVTEVPYFGRFIKMAGDRQFPDWRVTVINDEDYLVRKVMERWSHNINTMMKNTTFGFAGANPNTYKADGWVYKYGKEGNIIRRYKMIGIWPHTISPIALNWGDRDRIAEFNVEFSIDYWSDDEDVNETDGSGASNTLS